MGGVDPLASDSCIVVFHTFHLVEDPGDPDCCSHDAPNSLMFYIHPEGGQDDPYELDRTGPYSGMGYSCDVYDYQKGLSLQDEHGYYYRFAHESKTDCRCPPGGSDEDPDYMYFYVDCEPE